MTTGDVTLHTLRHTALSQTIAGGFDDYTVIAISGHSSTRMLERYTHPTGQRKIGALDSFAASMGRMWQNGNRTVGKRVVDGARLELAASALRTRRSPN